MKPEFPDIFICRPQDRYDIRRSRHGHNQMPTNTPFAIGSMPRDSWANEFAINSRMADNRFWSDDGVALTSMAHPNG